ncbi:MAG: DUF624 domain-containing protein [Blautia sp.]|nr:DUF624 domain-containing protein [Blautia sp.]
MDRIFNMDNKFFQFMGRIADLMLLNVLCIVCCIPVITIGASLSSMYYVTLKMVRDEESYITRSFFHSFKQNIKQSIPITLIMLAAGVLLYIDIGIGRSMEGMAGRVLFVMFMFMAILYLMIFIYIHPMLAKFYNSIRNLFVNSLLMGLRHLPLTFVMMIITAVPLLVLLVPDGRIAAILTLLLILLGIPLMAYAKSMILVRIFDKYIPAESEETPSDDLPAAADSPENDPDSKGSDPS